MILKCNQAFGVAVEWKTSETVVSQLVQTEGQDHMWSRHIKAERVTPPCPSSRKSASNAGPRRSKPGWYVGWHWSSPIGRSAWAENTWASGSTAGVARNYLSLVNTGLDVRLVLPE